MYHFYSFIVQVVIALRWVENDLSVNEEFIGLYVVNSIESSSLVHVNCSAWVYQ